MLVHTPNICSSFPGMLLKSQSFHARNQQELMAELCNSHMYPPCCLLSVSMHTFLDFYRIYMQMHTVQKPDFTWSQPEIRSLDCHRLEIRPWSCHLVSPGAFVSQ